MRIARLIITWDCNRNCSYCCNTYTRVMKQQRAVQDLSELLPYDVICITGGEPMLYPRRVVNIAKALRLQNQNVKLFVYTAEPFAGAVGLTRPFGLQEVLSVVDGMHLSLHGEATQYDVSAIREVQSFVLDHDLYKEKSFRLYIHPDVQHAITLEPRVWRRVELKPWLKEAEMELPAGEELLVYLGKA